MQRFLWNISPSNQGQGRWLFRLHQHRDPEELEIITILERENSWQRWGMARSVLTEENGGNFQKFPWFAMIVNEVQVWLIKEANTNLMLKCFSQLGLEDGLHPDPCAGNQFGCLSKNAMNWTALYFTI